MSAIEEEARERLDDVIVEYAADYDRPSYAQSTDWEQVEAALDAYRDALLDSRPVTAQPNEREALANLLRRVSTDQSLSQLTWAEYPFKTWLIERADEIIAAGFRLSPAALTQPEAARSLGDARGDGPCMDCGTVETPVWFADNTLWNWVVGGDGAREDPGGFLCPMCFIQRSHDAGMRPVSWRLVPEFPRRTVALEAAVSVPTNHTERSKS